MMRPPLNSLSFILLAVVASLQWSHYTGVDIEDPGISSRISPIFRCSVVHKCHAAFKKQQWVAARRELDLDASSVINWKQLEAGLSSRQTSFMRFMDSYHANAHSYITSENTTIFYARILKAGSEGIVSNLKLLPNYEYAVFYTEAGLAEYRYKHLNKMYKDPTNAYLDTFTFIRDPLAHFYSALAEIMDRTKHYGPINNYTVAMIDAWSIEAYIRALIEAELPQVPDFSKPRKQHPILAEVEHLSPMSNAFFVYDITIVKHLENFTKDWDYIRNRYKLKDAFRYDIGRHDKTEVSFPGSTKTDDFSHIHSRLKALFAEQPKYLRAVCHFIMIDYVCFEEYELPAECADMAAIRLQGRNMLKSNDCRKSEHFGSDDNAVPSPSSKKTWAFSPRPKQRQQQ